MDLRNLREITNERARAKEKRRREKERKKRRSLKYGQTELKHARRGIVSCVLAFCAVFLLGLIFSVSYISRGDVDLLIGAAGLIALALAAAGVVQGVQGLKERSKNYLTCKVGIVGNGFFLFIAIGTWIRGLF